MAFVDQLFPNPKLIHGLQKSVASPTTIVGNNQVEYRIRKLANYRTLWSWPARLMYATDRDTISKFYTEVANFSLNSFKFKDPGLHKWNLTPLTYTGTANYFYLTSRGTADTHPIFHIDADCVVKVGSTTTAFTKTVVDGQPVISVAGATSNVNITGTFYHAVRFNQAEMGWTMAALASDNSGYADELDDIQLIEVFEY